MRDMGYDLEEPVGLKNGRGIKVPLEPHLSEEQREAWLAGQYVDLTTYGLGYQPTTLPAPKTVSDAESSDTESCDSEISVSDLFKCSVNCVSVKEQTDEDLSVQEEDVEPVPPTEDEVK